MKEPLTTSDMQVSGYCDPIMPQQIWFWVMARSVLIECATILVESERAIPRRKALVHMCEKNR